MSDLIDIKLKTLVLVLVAVVVYRFSGLLLSGEYIEAIAIDKPYVRNQSDTGNGSGRTEFEIPFGDRARGSTKDVANPFVANEFFDKNVDPQVVGEYFQENEVEEIPIVFEQWLSAMIENVDTQKNVATATRPASGNSLQKNQWLGVDSSAPTIKNSNNQTQAASVELQSLEIEQTELIIAGHVVTTGGRPVNGLKISAVSKAGAAETVSGREGGFTLRGMKQGDYDVRVDGGDIYSSTKKLLRAGERGARLVVASLEPKKISGVVSDAYGVPVSGATVRAPEVDPVTTAVDGSFEFEVQRNNESGMLVRYKAAGFLDTSLHIVGDHWQQSEIDASIQMHEAGVMIFSGNVINDSNIPVPNAYVEIKSRSPAFRLSAKADEQGNFSIPNVRPSQSISFIVKAGSHYKNYQRSGLAMIEDTNVAVSLQSEFLTRLTATFTGSNGRLLSNMGFLATNSTHQNATVFGTSNTDGVLVIDDISPGSFLLRSAVNSPMIIVNGLDVGADSNAVHQIKVDIGPFVLRGLLMDADGRPVVNANLNMIHVNENEGVTAKTSRTAVSRSDGTFEFGGLGAGTREIVVASESGSNTTFYADPAESTSGVVVLR